MSLKRNALDIGNSREVEFVIGSDEAEVADAIYANKTRVQLKTRSANRQALMAGCETFFSFKLHTENHD